MTARPVWLLFALLVVLAAGCRQPAVVPTANASLQIRMQVEPAPPKVGDAALIVTVTDAAGQPVSDASLSARGDMSHAGMAPVLAEAVEGANGEYRLPFNWTMGGDWFVEITVTRPDGTTATQRFDVTVTS